MWHYVNQMKSNDTDKDKGTGIDFEAASYFFKEKFRYCIGRNERILSPGTERYGV